MNDGYQMSPLAQILMSVLRYATWIAAGLILLFAGLLLIQRRTVDGIVLQQGDKGFLVVLGVLLAMAIYIIRGIKNEINKPGG
jgi:hypothetical protein